jgi:hypothetical protein
MYRQVFTPTERNSVIPSVKVPREWYGQEVEILVFPLNFDSANAANKPKKDILQYFGMWKSNLSAETLVDEIYSSRTSGKTRVLEEL